MKPFAITLTIAALATVLGACEARIGNDAGEVAENATAAGRAEEGRLTVEAPGFNLSIDIPEGIKSNTNMDEDNALIYPGATFGGLHVQGTDKAGGRNDGEVELRFTTPDPIDRVVAWYRDPARGEEIKMANAAREGAGFVMSGTDREGDPFTLRVAPSAGGTEARLLLSDRQ